MRGLGVAALVGVVTVSVGCASAGREAAADREWQQGQWQQAAAAYEAALTGKRSPAHADRILYHLGLTYAVPDSPVHDAERSRARLRDLITSYPSSAYRQPARVVLGLLDALEATREEADALAERLQHAETDAKVGAATIERLRTSLTEARSELEKARKALAELKRIDLARPGGG